MITLTMNTPEEQLVHDFQEAVREDTVIITNDSKGQVLRGVPILNMHQSFQSQKAYETQKALLLTALRATKPVPPPDTAFDDLLDQMLAAQISFQSEQHREQLGISKPQDVERARLRFFAAKDAVRGRYAGLDAPSREEIKGAISGLRDAARATEHSKGYEQCVQKFREAEEKAASALADMIDKLDRRPKPVTVTYRVNDTASPELQKLQDSIQKNFQEIIRNFHQDQERKILDDHKVKVEDRDPCIVKAIEKIIIAAKEVQAGIGTETNVSAKIDDLHSTFKVLQQNRKVPRYDEPSYTEVRISLEELVVAANCGDLTRTDRWRSKIVQLFTQAMTRTLPPAPPDLGVVTALALLLVELDPIIGGDRRPRPQGDRAGRPDLA